ncbi:nuclear transport factor 2 family protein [Kitasatospora sp. NPDC051984]|uniref:nuclear transport factor 2 family protein n=1 Tax=Kitasatospora sp. NPDC051984 TaxID=3364059 RepID=UPI0037C77B3F
MERLWERWVDLWNGDFAAAADLVGERLEARLPRVGMPEEGTLTDGAALAAWIVDFRSAFRDARFSTELGPFAVSGPDGRRYLVARWRCEGVWDGGTAQGARAAPGTRVAYSGTDVLRIGPDGRFDGYWLSDDQLGVFSRLEAPVPAWT